MTSTSARLRRTFALGLLGLAALDSATAQAPSTPTSESEGFRVDAVLDVLVGEVRVVLPPREPAPEPQAFEVRWRDEPQRILRVVGGDDASLELGILIDVSASTAARFGELAATAREALGELLRPQDRAFVAAFGEAPRLLASGRGDAALAAAHVPQMANREGTAFFGSLLWALDQFHDEDPRAALVVLTDACDTADDPPVDEALERMRSESIPVYVFFLDDFCRVSARCPIPAVPCRDAVFVGQRPAENTPRTRFLDAARESGGRVVRLRRREHDTGLWEELAEQLRRQWLVVFERGSDAVRSDEVEVRLGGKRLRDGRRGEPGERKP